MPEFVPQEEGVAEESSTVVDSGRDQYWGLLNPSTALDVVIAQDRE